MLNISKYQIFELSFFIRNMINGVIDPGFQHFTDPLILFFIFPSFIFKEIASFHKISSFAFTFVFCILQNDSEIPNWRIKLSILLSLELKLLLEHNRFIIIVIIISSQHVLLFRYFTFKFGNQIIKMINLLCEVSIFLS